MIRNVEFLGGANFGGGVVTYQNFFVLQPNQSPAAIDVKFGLGNSVEKRLGTSTVNAVALVTASSSRFTVDGTMTLTGGLVAYWKLDEASSTRIDSWDARNLTGNNAVGFTAGGVIGTGALFIATSNQYLSRVSDAQLSIGDNDFTICAWVNLSSKAVSSDNTIVSKFSAGGNREYLLRYAGGTDRFDFVVRGTDNATETVVTAAAFGSPSTSSWIFLAAWHDSGANTINIQVNNGTVSSSSHTLGIFSGSADFVVGGWSDLSGTRWMNGGLDEIGLWRRTLTTAERTDLYNGGVGNTYTPGIQSNSWGMFDYGASALRWLVISAGTSVFVSSNRGVTFLTIATGTQTQNYQFYERSKPYLIVTSEAQNPVLYWGGSVGTFALRLAPGSAPQAKYAASFQGFLFLMNSPASKRSMAYADENTFTTDPWTNTFDLPSSFDDEITGSVILNKKLYVFTRYAVFRISHVGGNPDFAYQQVKSWGAVPGTIQKITVPSVGEVIICLSWDKTLKLFDGSEDEIISDPFFQDNRLSSVAFSLISQDTMQSCRAAVDTTEQVYKLLVPIGTASQAGHMICYNYRIGAFYPYQNTPFQVMTMVESSNSRLLMACDRSGRVHILDSGNRDITNAVNETFDSPFLFAKNPRVVTKAQKLYLYFEANSSGSVYLQDRTDFNTTFGPVRDVISFSNTGGTVQIQRSIDLPSTQNIYQFRLSSSSGTATPWQLNRFDYGFTGLGIGEG